MPHRGLLLEVSLKQPPRGDCHTVAVDRCAGKAGGRSPRRSVYLLRRYRSGVFGRLQQLRLEVLRLTDPVHLRLQPAELLLEERQPLLHHGDLLL